MLGHKKDKNVNHMGHKSSMATNAIGNKHNYGGHNNPVNFMNKDKDTTIHDNKNMSMTFPLGLSKK